MEFYNNKRFVRLFEKILLEDTVCYARFIEYDIIQPNMMNFGRGKFYNRQSSTNCSSVYDP